MTLKQQSGLNERSARLGFFWFRGEVMLLKSNYRLAKYSRRTLRLGNIKVIMLDQRHGEDWEARQRTYASDSSPKSLQTATEHPTTFRASPA